MLKDDQSLCKTNDGCGNVWYEHSYIPIEWLNVFKRIHLSSGLTTDTDRIVGKKVTKLICSRCLHTKEI